MIVCILHLNNAFYEGRNSIPVNHLRKEVMETKLCHHELFFRHLFFGVNKAIAKATGSDWPLLIEELQMQETYYSR